MNKHTEGPWIVSSLLSGSENHRGFRVMDGANRWALATVQPGDSDGDLGRANAHLIAAAPDLLEALLWCKEQGFARYSQRVKGQNDTFCDAVDRMNAAIAKATGEQP